MKTNQPKSAKGPTFGMLFRTLTTAADTSANEARAKIETSIQTRLTRLTLIRDHIKGGGTITAAQKKRLSAPELAYVKGVEIGEDPDVKAAVAEAERMATEGVNIIKKGLVKILRKID